MFSDKNELKLEINNRKIAIKVSKRLETEQHTSK